MPRRQKTYHVTIRDRVAGFLAFEQIRVHRNRKIEYGPCLYVGTTNSDSLDQAAIDRINERRDRLAGLLWKRTFPDAAH
jgi:hypothetical protein